LFILGNSLEPDCSIAEQIRASFPALEAPVPLSPRSLAGGPRQLFANTPAERVALARTQFFEEGVRPSGLVGEAVIQSWMRCARSHADTRRTIAFDAVTPSRLHATLARNHDLLAAAHGELVGMESSLAGTDCRVLLTDAQGVIVHVTHNPSAPQQPIVDALRAWRLDEARRNAIAPFVVLHDRTLIAIASELPGSPGELSSIPGIGPAKLASYGDAILNIVKGSR